VPTAGNVSAQSDHLASGRPETARSPADSTGTKTLRDHPNAHKAPREETPYGWRFIAAKITLPHVCFRIIALPFPDYFFEGR
jgi:hypothetical protein